MASFGPGPVAAQLAFERDVRPIFKVACFHCHGEDDVREGGLDLRLVRLMEQGGESGPALEPGRAESSLLWDKIAADEMPKGEKKLSTEDKERIRDWIAQGAKTARPEPEDPEDARFTLEELEHWSFRPVKGGSPPDLSPPDVGAGPVDAFVAARLREAGFGFSDVADRTTLIRRVYFDLTGLPPDPGEVEAQLRDDSPEAWERLLDRLLASPQNGVRWARHWMDAAGFAESDGDAAEDATRPHAWRYRDYVIDAFNANKPIDEFFIEQLAGDELMAGEISIDSPRHLELLVATGFLRMAPDLTGRQDGLAERNAAAAGTLQIVGTSLLGLTVGCAQCHDHKYDPIGIDDYYRLRAVFDPAFPLENWQQPGRRLVDMTTPEVRAERERIEAVAREMESDLEARRGEHCRGILERKLADVPADVREAAREAVSTDSDRRTSGQTTLLDRYPMVKPVDFIIGLLVEYDGAAFRRFEKEKERIAAVRATMPPLRMVRTTTEPPGKVPVSRVFFRGDPGSPREEVEPAELAVLRLHRPDRDVPPSDPERRTTGRRLAYARELTDGTHPLAARVFVNRVWMHHFGRGLVATPDDFGIAGERPSHPALLDWLATEFVRSGWDLKRLHRAILVSETYRQRSRRRADLERVDPENALLGRANLRRLEAEAIRDALLAVTGQLSLDLGGPSSAVTENAEGKAVLGGDPNRRSAFVEVRRSLPLNMLATFDQPVMTPNCGRRRPTTVATQALWFLNDREVLEHSESLAGLLAREAPSGPSARVERLFLRLFGRPPEPAEEEYCEHFLAEQRAWFAERDPDADADHRALASLCQVLLASNRFLYLD